jgi:hypothetical protein
MMNYRSPGLRGFEEIFKILTPSKEVSSGKNLFFTSNSNGSGDPFTAASSRNRADSAPPDRTYSRKPGMPAQGRPTGDRPYGRDQSGDDWKPYPRMREGYRMPALMSGAENGQSILANPVLWLIAGVGVLVALEATGATNLSKKD